MESLLLADAELQLELFVEVAGQARDGGGVDHEAVVLPIAPLAAHGEAQELVLGPDEFEGRLVLHAVLDQEQMEPGRVEAGQRLGEAELEEYRLLVQRKLNEISNVAE